MNLSLPIIHAPWTTSHRLGWLARTLAAAVGVCCLLVLLTAARVAPDARGVGTHEALGLPACGLLQSTGIPCMTCGMTTAFSLLVRGHVLDSLYTQPAGATLGFLTAITAWISFYTAISARPVYRLLTDLPARFTWLPLIGLGALAWGWKIATSGAG